MPQFVISLWFLINELLRIPFDIVRGTAQRRYSCAFDIQAPKDVTWSVASAHKITLEGFPPFAIDTEPDPNRPGVFTGFVRSASKNYAFAYRVLEERLGEAMTLEILSAESDRIFQLGENYKCAVGVSGDGAKSNLIASYDITHTHFRTRISMPLGLVQSGARLKRTAEVRAGTWLPTSNSQIKNALITGALTFASFFAMFGPSAAAILIVLILIHELGHVIAMRWAGIPVKGIYFVPFFGGVAIGEGAAKTEAVHGLVALMGPGFSILTTALFCAFAAQGNDPFPRQLAIMSALLNGFNLLPVLPLDGGHVMQSLLSRFGDGVARAFRFGALIAGCALAFWINDVVLLGLFIVLAPAVISRREIIARLPPLTGSELTWLVSGYAAAILFYATVLARFWGIQLP